ncbi:hypothetical protein F5Y12DRAFT_736088 [Xylaria sp. FL1777]|nr:hypothetical protein F5Y12DRAFT_736088 [Xylaria sp. FL1777]
MIASYFGLDEVKILLLREETCVAAKNNIHGHTASWAVENRFDDIVKLLVNGSGMFS